MPNRRKWKEVEDGYLREIIKSEDMTKPMWAIVQYKMEQKGFIKTTRQCRERWMYHLDPKVLKGEWTTKKNKKLFEIHKKYGNQWKLISTKFKNRTAHSIKNHFFSLIRKSLRVAFKMIGKNKSSLEVKLIKPKIITESMNEIIDIKMKDSKILTVSINDFIEKFVFDSKVKNMKLSDKELFIIENCLNFLKNKNEGYLEEKNICKIKKKIQKRNKKTEKEEKNNNDDITMENYKDKRKKYMKTSKCLTNNSFTSEISPLINTYKEIENLIEEEEKIKSEFDEPIDYRNKLILIFKRIKNLSKSNIGIIRKSKKKDLMNYAKAAQVNSPRDFYPEKKDSNNKIDFANIFERNNFPNINRVEKIESIFNNNKLKIPTFALNNSIFQLSSKRKEMLNEFSDKDSKSKKKTFSFQIPKNKETKFD